jgi:phage tail-like protein
MASVGPETMGYPFLAFSFSVEIRLPGRSDPLCNAAFAECDGLEVSMDIKTIREGGNNDTQIRLAGPHTFGTLTLKRGMTASSDLWDWVSQCLDDPGLRADVSVVVLSAVAQGPGAREELTRFDLARCLPQRLKAPPLNAKDGMVAIEELQISYESLRRQPKASGGRPAGGT